MSLRQWEAAPGTGQTSTESSGMSVDYPHYHQHRQRRRQRFIKHGLDGFADYEMIELLLTLAIPRADVKQPAKALSWPLSSSFTARSLWPGSLISTARKARLWSTLAPWMRQSPLTRLVLPSLIKDAQGEVIGFERLYFKPKEALRELGVVLQTAKT
jgi:hypothetical protein